MLKTSGKFKVQRFKVIGIGFLVAMCNLLAVGCRYDMQDQPRYKAYKESDFFDNKMGSRGLVEGTVPRGYLREDKALYTGKKDNAATAPNALSLDGGKSQTQDGTNAQRTATTTTSTSATNKYPDDIDEFPLPVTKELIDRGEERYRVFCIVCHGPNGEGNGMVVRRGFSPPPSYNTEELRGAPVGHFYDVVTNGWGRMSGYSAQIPVTDRWAIVAYIRALQASNPNLSNNPANPNSSPTPATMSNAAAVKTETNGGGHQ